MTLQIRVPEWLAATAEHVPPIEWVDEIEKLCRIYEPGAYSNYNVIGIVTVMVQVPMSALGVLSYYKVQLRDAELLCRAALMKVGGYE